MIEKRLQKRLRKATILVICICTVFLICGGLFSSYLARTREEFLREQVIAETEEYKNRILKQLEADFQTLSTLSVFLNSEYISDAELLAGHLRQTQEYNEYITIAYYNTDGKGVIASRGRDILTGAGLSDLSPEGADSIEKALNGESCVSRLFESQISGNRVFVYSVPVYENGKIIGALAASDHIEIFSDILSGNTVFGGGGYIHLIDSEGDFLVRSSNSVVKDNVPSIFEGPYLSGESRSNVEDALENQKRIFSSFSYNGRDYPFLLEPIGLNNWYLFCVNTGDSLNARTDISTHMAQLMAAAIVLLVIFLMLYGYRLMRNYNKDLLYLAYHDALTGAENMSRFRQKLIETLKTGRGSVAAFTIRQFPFLTEIFGKEKSDQLLRQIREIADRHIKAEEFFCRDAEDRFYLFFKDTEKDIIRQRLEAFISEIEKTTIFNRTDYQLAIYCGVTISSDSADPEAEAENMLTHIHFALNKARGGHSSTDRKSVV